jgi:putative flippase GtrA
MKKILSTIFRYLFQLPKTQFEKFSLAGTVAFLIEAALLFLFQHWWGTGPFVSRIPAFSVVFFASWAAKRYLVFEERETPFKASLLRYLYASLGKIVLSWGIYTMLVQSSEFLSYFSPLALLIAGTVTSPLSFWVSKYAVFRKKEEPVKEVQKESP